MNSCYSHRKNFTSCPLPPASHLAFASCLLPPSLAELWRSSAAEAFLLLFLVFTPRPRKLRFLLSCRERRPACQARNTSVRVKVRKTSFCVFVLTGCASLPTPRSTPLHPPLLRLGWGGRNIDRIDWGGGGDHRPLTHCENLPLNLRIYIPEGDIWPPPQKQVCRCPSPVFLYLSVTVYISLYLSLSVLLSLCLSRSLSLSLPLSVSISLSVSPVSRCLSLAPFVSTYVSCFLSDSLYHSLPVFLCLSPCISGLSPLLFLSLSLSLPLSLSVSHCLGTYEATAIAPLHPQAIIVKMQSLGLNCSDTTITNSSVELSNKILRIRG